MADWLARVDWRKRLPELGELRDHETWRDRHCCAFESRIPEPLATLWTRAA